jgi:muramoyltetrapeptide carboxypeptidase
MKKLSALKSGDIIDIIAPASRASDQTFTNAINWIKSNGFIARYHPSLNKGSEFFAANEKLQWAELKRALTASDSKAIWCLRGGWGSMRFFSKLNKLKRPGQAKIFIGFSDITSLHIFLNQKWDWPTYHGSNLARFGRPASKAFQKDYLELIKGTNKTQVFSKLKALNASDKTIIKGKIVGGNLCVLTCTLGTANQIDTKGKILFIEDTGERGYKIDRMFEQLLQAGVLNQARAIILGDFIDGLEPNGKPLAKIAFKRLLEKVKIPVLKGMPCGHGKKNRLLPFNTSAVLDLEKMTLNVKSGI